MRYSKEEKLSLVNFYYNGKSVTEICMEHQIPRSTVYSWIQTYQPVESKNSSRTVTPKDFDSLLRRCEKQEQIIAVLKSIPAISNATTQEKLAVLEPLYGQFSRLYSTLLPQAGRQLELCWRTSWDSHPSEDLSELRKQKYHYRLTGSWRGQLAKAVLA